MAVAIAAGVGSVASGLLGALGSSSAASTAAKASSYAANLQQADYQFSQTQLANMYAPTFATENQLSSELSPGGYLNQTYQYSPYGGPDVPDAPTIDDYSGPGVPTAPTIAAYGGPGVPTAPTINPYTGPGVNMNVPVAPTLQQFDPTQAALNAMPGYQFEQAQALKGIQAANAAEGRGVSGAAMEQAGAEAQGLASQDLNNYYTQFMGNQNLLLQGYGAQLSGYQTGLSAQSQNYNQWLNSQNLNLSQYQQQLAGQQQGFGQWQAQGNMALNQYQQALAAQAQGYGQWQGSGQMTLSQYQAALQGQAQNYTQWQSGQTTAQQIFAANQMNQYSMMQGQATMGTNAIVGAATNTANMSASIAQSLQNAGGAQAAGTIGATNSLGQAITNATTPYGTGNSATSPVAQAINYITGSTASPSGGTWDDAPTSAAPAAASVAAPAASSPYSSATMQYGAGTSTDNMLGG
jgi:hypothetical protein